MKVSVKKIDYINDNHKMIYSFHITQNEFEGFFMSQKGKKILKEILPSEMNVNHPSILQFIRLLYAINSSAPPGCERDFWMYDSTVKKGQSPTKVFLEHYLPNQLTVSFKIK